VILIWSSRAWDDYLYWQEHNPQFIEKINRLIKDVSRSPFKGLGKPEPLGSDRSGWWSRRIDNEHRFVYRVGGKGDAQHIEIAQCRMHY
jgi:toxin YoeB